MTDDLTALASAVQGHVSPQPWGVSGNHPVGLNVTFDANSYNSRSTSNPRPWQVRFVIGLNRPGTKRVWARAYGATLAEALTDARRQQEQET